MLKIILGFLLIFSGVSAFANSTSTILSNVPSSGICIDDVGGLFVFHVDQNLVTKNVYAYVSSNLCNIDAIYTPQPYVEVKIDSLSNGDYVQRFSFRDTKHGHDDIILTHYENNLEEFSAETKKLIDDACISSGICQ